MTALTDTQVITASGGLVELGYFESASAVNLDPTTTTVVSAQTIVSDGSPLLLEYYSRTCYANNADLQAQVGFSVDGAAASTDGFFASPATGLYRQPFHIQKRVTLAAGSHTIAVQGFRNAGLTIMGLDGPMFLRVSKIVQATQWPAVTTGTIICTSTTRPASPFEGQTIYETDTNKEFTYTGSAWTESALFRTANGAVVDNYRVPPMCRLVRTTDQTITIDTDTRVQFNSSVFDTNPTMATTGASAKITINTPGVYSINAYSQWTSVGVANNYRYHWVRLNLGSVRLASFRIYNPGGNMGLSSSDIVSLASGDELEMYVRSEVASSSLGSQVNMGETRASFAVAWLGQVS